MSLARAGAWVDLVYVMRQLLEKAGTLPDNYWIGRRMD